jgi:hypothetical protein
MEMGHPAVVRIILLRPLVIACTAFPELTSEMFPQGLQSEQYLRPKRESLLRREDGYMSTMNLLMEVVLSFNTGMVVDFHLPVRLKSNLRKFPPVTIQSILMI